jgi:hypothetical protein
MFLSHVSLNYQMITFHIMALPLGTKNGIEVADPAFTII